MESKVFEMTNGRVSIGKINLPEGVEPVFKEEIFVYKGKEFDTYEEMMEYMMSDQ